MTKLAMTVDEFCQSHGISRATFYNLLREGNGPAVMRLGSRTLIGVEAAADWRRGMEGKVAKTRAA